MKVTKCDDENKVSFFKVTKRANCPKPATYDEDVSRESSAELFRLMWKRLQSDIYVGIVALG
jgi:hypothetical protein